MKKYDVDTQGTSNKNQQDMFLWRNKKTIYLIPTFI